jgi:hypothetical protein
MTRFLDILCTIGVQLLRLGRAPHDLLPVIAILGTAILAIAWFLYTKPSAVARRRIIREANAISQAFHEQKRRRIAELAANPARSKYIPLLEQGQVWSDRDIDYLEDPTMVVTCPHLQPLERAIRSARIGTRIIPRRPPGEIITLQMDCSTDPVELQRRFPLPASIHYSEWYQPDRAYNDNPTAALQCGDCSSGMYVIHPEAARPGTPIFPTAS